MSFFKKTPTPDPQKTQASGGTRLVTPQKEVVLADRRELLADLAQMALLGHVAADAIIGQIRTNFSDELAEDCRQKDHLEQLVECKLRNFQCTFPTLAEPRPEAPLPEPGRHYGRLSADRLKPAHLRR